MPTDYFQSILERYCRHSWHHEEICKRIVLGERKLESDHVLKRFPTDEIFFFIFILKGSFITLVLLYCQVLPLSNSTQLKTGWALIIDNFLAISYDTIGMKEAIILHARLHKTV